MVAIDQIFSLGGLNQAAHAAGGVEHEHDLDAMTLGRGDCYVLHRLDCLRLLYQRETGDAGCGGD